MNNVATLLFCILASVAFPIILASLPVSSTLKTNLLSLNLAELTTWCENLGEKPFRARQLYRWVHQKRVDDIDAMTELAKPFRAKLQELACIQAPGIHQTFYSRDGTVKWLIDVSDGNLVEMVFIPEPKRGTLCVSSQAGCAVNCKFCSTGKQGFSRNLRVDEIIGQLWLAERLLRQQSAYAHTPADEKIITNIVMMGMGEPLLNYEAVKSAIGTMLHDDAYGLSKRRVTLSTSGIVPFIDRLGKEMPVSLAVSLHAPNNPLRDVLVPINKKYPLDMLMQACYNYLSYAPRDFITFEYCMLDGWNDRPEHAYQLVECVRNIPCKFNLIPFNPFPESGLQVSKPQNIQQFARILMDHGLVTTIRKTRGDDIDAACGQLAGDIQDRTRIEQRVQVHAKPE